MNSEITKLLGLLEESINRITQTSWLIIKAEIGLFILSIILVGLNIISLYTFLIGLVGSTIIFIVGWAWYLNLEKKHRTHIHTIINSFRKLYERDLNESEIQSKSE
jgi:hypothetical protein